MYLYSLLKMGYVDFRKNEGEKIMVDAETGIIIQRKLELILELLIIQGDDDKKLFSFMRKELHEVLEIFKQIK